MKKTLLTSVLALGVSGAAFAQGVVSWSTIAPTFLTAQTNSTVYSYVTGGGSALGGSQTVGSTTTVGGSFYYALLYNSAATAQSAPTTLAGLNGWLATGLTATNNTGGAGRLSVVNPSTAATVPWAQGTSDSIMVVGWSSNLGTSWSTVLNELNNWNTLGSTIAGDAFFGETAAGYINPNTPPASGATIFGSSANANGTPINSPNTQLDLLQVVVPEPGTIALAAIGGASLLMFRRKK